MTYNVSHIVIVKFNFLRFLIHKYELNFVQEDISRQVDFRIRAISFEYYFYGFENML